jgi:large subunit ribosomal protein L2
MSFFKKNIIIKKFNLSKKSSGGKNNRGVTTVRHISLGHKKKHRLVDYFRLIREVPGRVRRIEYDANRNSYLALICYKNSVLSYMIAYDGIKINDFIIAGNSVNTSYGNSTLISQVSIGSLIYNLEFFPNFGGKIARSAGSFCQVLKKYSENYVLVRLKSKEYRMFFKDNFVTYGIVSNKYKKFEKLYKAGQNIYRGIRPHVRGEAMNPVDHPHGGNTSGGRHPVSYTGKLTKGVKTRLKNKISNSLIYKIRSKNIR